MSSHKHTRASQRGVAMFICLFALLLLTAIGMALMYTGDTETSINSNFRSSQAAYYAAKAGLEEGRERLRFGQAYTIPWAAGQLQTLPTTANGNGVIYIINNQAGENVTPWGPAANNPYFDDELCHENYAGLGLGPGALGVPCTNAVVGKYYTTAPTGAGISLDPNWNTNGAMPYKWVRITLKQVGSTSPYCLTGAAQCATAADDPKFNSYVCAQLNSTVTPAVPYEVVNPTGNAQTCENAATNLRSVYLVTALAITNTGARRMVQYEVSNVALPPFPAALTLDGSGPTFVPPNSNAYTGNGNDAAATDGTAQCKGSTPQAAKPAVGSVDNAGVNAIVTAIQAGGPNNKLVNNYLGAGYSAPATPSVQNVNTNAPPMDPTFKYCNGIQSLYNTLLSTADNVYGNNPGVVPIGTNANPLTTIVNGNFTMNSKTTGAGILVVTGNLSFSGAPNFNGVVLVIGNGAMIAANGGGSGNIYGSLFIANCFNATAPNWSGNFSNCNGAGQNPGTGAQPCLPGPPTWNYTNGGGTLNIQYDSCWVNLAGNHSVFKILASREEMY